MQQFMVLLTERWVDFGGKSVEEKTHCFGPFRHNPGCRDGWDQGESSEANHWLAENGFVRVRTTLTWIKPVDHGTGLQQDGSIEGKAFCPDYSTEDRCGRKAFRFISARVDEMQQPRRLGRRL